MSFAVFPSRVGRVILDGVVNPHIWLNTDISLVRQSLYSHLILPDSFDVLDHIYRTGRGSTPR